MKVLYEQVLSRSVFQFAQFYYRCFSLLVQLPTKGISFKNSEVLSWAYCDSSKPGRSTTRFVLLVVVADIQQAWKTLDPSF